MSTTSGPSDLDVQTETRDIDETIFSTFPSEMAQHFLKFFPFFPSSEKLTSLKEILELEKFFFGKNNLPDKNTMWAVLFKNVFPHSKNDNPAKSRDMFFLEYNYYLDKHPTLKNEIEPHLLQCLQDFKNFKLTVRGVSGKVLRVLALCAAENGCPYGLAHVLKTDFQKQFLPLDRAMDAGTKKAENLILPSCLGEIEKIDQTGEISVNYKSFLYSAMAISGHPIALTRLSQEEKAETLIRASRLGSIIGIRMILTNAGEEISALKKGEALFAAVGNCHLNIVKMLLAKCGDDISTNVKIDALRWGSVADLTLIEHLVDKASDPIVFDALLTFFESNLFRYPTRLHNLSDAFNKASAIPVHGARFRESIYLHLFFTSISFREKPGYEYLIPFLQNLMPSVSTGTKKKVLHQIANLLLSKFSNDTPFLIEAFLNHYQYDSLFALQWAIENGFVDIFYHLWELESAHLKPMIIEKLFVLAINRNQIEIVNFLVKKHGKILQGRFKRWPDLKAQLQADHIAKARELLITSEAKYAKNTGWNLVVAAENSNLALLDACLRNEDKIKSKHWEAAYLAAAKQGFILILNMLEKFCKNAVTQAFCDCGREANLNVFHYLFDRLRVLKKNTTIHESVLSLFTNILSYYDENQEKSANQLLIAKALLAAYPKLITKKANKLLLELIEDEDYSKIRAILQIAGETIKKELKVQATQILDKHAPQEREKKDDAFLREILDTPAPILTWGDIPEIKMSSDLKPIRPKP